VAVIFISSHLVSVVQGTKGSPNYYFNTYI